MLLRIIIFFMTAVYCSEVISQTLDLEEFDVVINDSFINKNDFIESINNIDSSRLKGLTFVVIKDGFRRIYYLDGQLWGEGEMKNKKENGFWTFWHRNGQKAREGYYDEGQRTGKNTYWYENGNLRGIGNFKSNEYHGQWIMYSEDGELIEEQFYKNGKKLGK